MLRVRSRSLVGAALVCGLALAGCGGSPAVAGPGRTTTTTTRGTGSSPTTTGTTASTGPGSTAPAVYPATYTDTPVGQPGYALVVNPGAAGSGTLGGVAVFQYQDGKEAGYFSFSGRAVSGAPFPLAIKGDRAATTVTAQLTTGSAITIEDCGRLFSPAVVNGANDEAVPPGPVSCTFTYKLAPGPPRSALGVATNLTASAAINTGLVTAYLYEHGWQATYGSDISLVPASTYLAYDPGTGLDWAYASFSYHGPQTDTGDSPDVAMQDGGDTGIFYRIPDPGALASGDDGWVMVSSTGEPRCYAGSVLPRSVTGLWGLVDPPACNPS